MKRIEILKLVASGEVTPNKAEMMLDGLSVARRGRLLDIRKGSKVIVAKSASLRAKFGERKLTVKRLQFDSGAGFCRMTFEETPDNDWYYENFFSRAK